MQLQDGQYETSVRTVGDRVAQTVVARRPERTVEPIFHPTPTATGRAFGLGRGRHLSATVLKSDWVIDLDIKVLRHRAVGLGPQGDGGEHRRPVGGAVCAARATGAAARRGRVRAGAGSGDPPRVRGLGRARRPVPARRVRRLDRPGVPDRPVRTLRGRRGRALRQPRPGAVCGPGDPGQDESGRAGVAPGQDEDHVRSPEAFGPESASIPFSPPTPLGLHKLGSGT